MTRQLRISAHSTEGVIRASATMLMGVGGGQVIAFLSTLVLARMFLPEAFGDLAQFTAIITIVSVIASGRYEIAVPAVRDESEAYRLVRLALMLVLVVSGLTLLVVLIIGGSSLLAEDSWSLNVRLLLVPFGVFVLGVTQVLSYWHTRQNTFKSISSSLLIRAASASAVQLTFGLVYLRAGEWLIVGFVLGQVLAFGALWRSALPRWNEIHGGPPRPRFDRPLLLRHSDYIRFGSGQVLTNALSQSLPVLGLTYLFNMSVVGQYSMAVRVLMVPVNMVAGSVRQVVYRELSGHENRSRRWETWKQTTLGLFGLGLIPLVATVVWGPHLFSAVLGDSWRAAGEYARWLSPWLFASLVNPPSTMAIPLLRLQKMHLFFELATAVMRLAAIVAGGVANNPVVVVAGFGVIGIASNCWLIAKVGRILFLEGREFERDDTSAEVVT